MLVCNLQLHDVHNRSYSIKADRTLNTNILYSVITDSSDWPLAAWGLNLLYSYVSIENPRVNSIATYFNLPRNLQNV